MSTNLTITANRDLLLSFAKVIHEHLTHLLQDDTTKHGWKHKFEEICEAGFATKRFSRNQFAKLILGPTVKDKSLTNILFNIRNLFPPVDATFEFNPDSNDTDLWHMQQRVTLQSKKKMWMWELKSNPHRTP